MLNETTTPEAQTKVNTDEVNEYQDQTVSVFLNLGAAKDRIGLMLELLDDPCDFFEHAKLVESFDCDASAIHVTIARPEWNDDEFGLIVRFSEFESKDLRENLVTAVIDPATYFGMCNLREFSADPDGNVCLRFDPPVEAIR